MSSESERDLIRAAVLIEEETRLLRALFERLREYHETTTKKIDDLPRQLTEHITLEVASKLRALRWQERQVEQEDTRPDNVIVRRDPTPAFGTPLHMEQTGQIPLITGKLWWERVLGVVPPPIWFAALGAAGLLLTRLLLGIKGVVHAP